jgi:hypothetical protein
VGSYGDGDTTASKSAAPSAEDVGEPEDADIALDERISSILKAT